MITIELTQQERVMLMQALDSAPTTGLGAMKGVLMLAQKLAQGKDVEPKELEDATDNQPEK